MAPGRKARYKDTVEKAFVGQEVPVRNRQIMYEDRFLEQALEEIEYWKQKYEELRKETQSLIDWVKKTYKEETMKSD